MVITTKQTLTLDNSSIIKDNSEVVNTLNLQAVTVNLLEWNRTKDRISAGQTLHVDFWTISPTYINIIAKGNLRMYLGRKDKYATFGGKVTGMTTDVLITANNAGTGGNITLLAVSGNDIEQMITNRNIANPTNTVTLTSGNPEQIPTANIVLSGGATYTRADTDPYIENVLNFSLSGDIAPITLVNLSTTEEVDVDLLIAQA